MNETNNKRHISKIIVLVISLIIIGVSGTYAYYTTIITGNPSTTTLNSGVIKIDTNLETVSAINNAKIALIDNDQKETQAEKINFYVTNTAKSTVSAKYYIYLKDIFLSKNLYSNYFHWEILQNGTIINSGTFATATRTDSATAGEAANVITSAADIALNTDALTIAANSTDNLIFRIWMENDPDVNQIALTNGSFSGRLYLEAVPVSENA